MSGKGWSCACGERTKGAYLLAMNVGGVGMVCTKEEKSRFISLLELGIVWLYVAVEEEEGVWKFVRASCSLLIRKSKGYISLKISIYFSLSLISTHNAPQQVSLSFLESPEDFLGWKVFNFSISKTTWLKYEFDFVLNKECLNFKSNLMSSIVFTIQ